MEFSKRYFLFLILAFELNLSVRSSAIQSTSPKVFPVKDPNNIILTFGSCNSFFGDEPNDIFYRIAELHPDIWIWLGDVAYIDLLNKSIPPRFGFAGEESIRKRLLDAKNDPVYKTLRESTNVIGVWDDHDYGKNNAGKNFPHKDLTQQLWLDFLDEPKDSIRRHRKGIYESYYLGDPTKIKIILLDVRYFRDEQWIIAIGGTDVLGEEQWKWLENELKENKAEYVIIGSGSQVISDDRFLPETWYPESRDRLINLIKKYKTSGVILLSGDVHYAEIMKYPCKERVGFELYEFTSSGITHHVASHASYVDRIVAKLYPPTWNNLEDKYFERNFGVIRFSFGEKKGVTFEARNFYGVLVLEKHIPYSSLTFDETILSNTTECIVDIPRHIRFWNHYKESMLHGEFWMYLATFVCLWVIILVITIIRLPFVLLFWIYRRIVKNKSSVQKPKRE